MAPVVQTTGLQRNNCRHSARCAYAELPQKVLNSTKHCSFDLRHTSETCQMKRVHQVPYHKRVYSFSVFVLKWSSCVQNPVNTLSSLWFPKYSCWELYSVSNNPCGRCLCGVPIYIHQRFSNYIPGNQGGWKEDWMGFQNWLQRSGAKSCTYRESIPNPRTSSPHVSHYKLTLMRGLHWGCWQTKTASCNADTAGLLHTGSAHYETPTSSDHHGF